MRFAIMCGHKNRPLGKQDEIKGREKSDALFYKKAAKSLTILTIFYQTFCPEVKKVTAGY
jgi:hypothetical protein